MSLWREFAAAGPGCAAANGLLNCFETTKVKLQLLHRYKHSIASSEHHHPLNTAYETPTMRGIMTQITKEEGVVRGLMTPGLSASLTRSMLYGAYRVGLYSTFREYLAGNGHSNGNNGNKKEREVALKHRLMSGMLTGGIGSMLSCPLDVVRTRLQADSGLIQSNNVYATGLRKGKAVRYHGMFQTLITIYKHEGLTRGLYRGASVTVARASLLNGAQLASYDTLKRTLNWDEGPILHVTCALSSGIIAQTLIMPVDTIKSQMMLGDGYKSVIQSIQRNGTFWLFKGWAPACVGQGTIMVLQMPLIEELRRLLGVKAI